MSLVNGNSFVFIHIYKCGGMSLRKAISNNLSVNEFIQSHATAKEVRDYCYACDGKWFWNSAYKFTFIRNPFDWVVSLYEFIRNNPTHENYDEVKELTFNEFCKWNVDAIKESKSNVNGKLNTLTGFLYDDDGRLLVDFVGRLENAEEDFKVIAKRLNIPLKNIHKINFPHINQSDREPDYRGYYDEESKIIISEAFHQDLVNFNYTF